MDWEVILNKINLPELCKCTMSVSLMLSAVFLDSWLKKIMLRKKRLLQTPERNSRVSPWLCGRNPSAGQQDGPAVSLGKCRLIGVWSSQPRTHTHTRMRSEAFGRTLNLTSQPEGVKRLGFEQNMCNQTVCVYPSLTHFPCQSHYVFVSLLTTPPSLHKQL